jgi:cytidylate kinase
VTKIITIEREYGCGAGAISRELGRELGWSVWDREISEEIARRLRCEVQRVQEREERPDPTYYRLLKIFMRGSYEDSFQGRGVELLDSESLFNLFERVISDLGVKGNCVIVGRAAPWFLRERPDAFHVFLYGSTADKIQRVMSMGKSRPEAELLVEHVDSERAAFVKKYYGKQWPLRELYHLMMNTKVGTQAVVKTVLAEIDLINKPSVRSA